MSPDDTIFIRPTTPLRHSTCMSRMGHSTGQFAPTNYCRRSQMSESACWAATSRSMILSITSSYPGLAAGTAHTLPSTSRPHCVELARDSASALP
ncbi:hypothetical protein T08_9454 [Trichinella sp. T8]|nr:hypothetical protein T08_9454 [Trichinella sp. T8]